MSCRLARISTPWVGRALSAVMIALLGVANVLPCAMPGSRSHCAPESANAETTPEVSVAGAHARHSTDIHPEPGVPSAQFASPESTESAVHVGHPAGHAPEPPIVLTPCASGCELVDLRTPVTGASRPGESRPARIAPARASVSDPLAIEHVPLIRGAPRGGRSSRLMILGRPRNCSISTFLVDSRENRRSVHAVPSDCGVTLR